MGPVRGEGGCGREGLAPRAGDGAGGTQAKGAGAGAAAAVAGGGDRGGEGGGDTTGGGGVQYLFGVAQEWRQQAEAAKGQLSAVGLTVQLLSSQQSGGGPTVGSVLPDYLKTVSSHYTMASEYSTETMVKAACNPDFSIPKPPAGSGMGSSGSQASP